MANKFARYLRVNQTDAERMLWQHLKPLKSQGFHFRRQAPIGPYIVDFVCHSVRLVVELDGGQHGLDENIHRDKVRTDWLQGEGYRVLRFWNNDVLGNIEGVYRTIADALV